MSLTDTKVKNAKPTDRRYQDLLAPRLAALRPQEGRHGALTAADDLAHGRARHFERLGPGSTAKSEPGPALLRPQHAA
jgi:hypothetical protein